MIKRAEYTRRGACTYARRRASCLIRLYCCSFLRIMRIHNWMDIINYYERLNTRLVFMHVDTYTETNALVNIIIWIRSNVSFDACTISMSTLRDCNRLKRITKRIKHRIDCNANIRRSERFRNELNYFAGILSKSSCDYFRTRRSSEQQ